MFYKCIVRLIICVVMAFCMSVTSMAADFTITIFWSLPDRTSGHIHKDVPDGSPIALKDILPMTMTSNSVQYSLESLTIEYAGVIDRSLTGAEVANGETYAFRLPDSYEILATYSNGVAVGGGGSRKSRKTPLPTMTGVVGVDWKNDLAAGKTYRFFTIPKDARLDFDEKYIENKGPGKGFMHADEDDGYFYLTPARPGKTTLRFTARGHIDRSIEITIK